MPTLIDTSKLTNRLIAALSVVLCVVVSSACSRIGDLPFVYKIDIQQGNVIDEVMLAKLQQGMDKRQVRFLLGTPLLADTFNQDRWDYYYSYAVRGDNPVQRSISLYFEQGRLVRLEGDVEPRLGPPPSLEREDVLVEVPYIDRRIGILASLTPEFLSEEPTIKVAENTKEKRQNEADGIVVESLPGAGLPQPTVVSASLANDTPGVTAAAAPAAPIATEQSALTNIFRGFGREGVPVAGSPLAPAGGPAAEPPVTPAPGTDATEAGFFRGMANRYQQWQDEASSTSNQGISADDLESSGQN